MKRAIAFIILGIGVYDDRGLAGEEFGRIWLQAKAIISCP
jgi:hypothetical protein